MSIRWWFVFPVALACLFAPASASAQGGGDFGVGYSIVRNGNLAENSSLLPGGWYTSGTANVSSRLAIAWGASGAFNFGIPPGEHPVNLSRAAQAAAADNKIAVVPPSRHEEFQGLSYHRAEALWCSPTLSLNPGDCGVQINSIGAGAGPRLYFGEPGGVRPWVQVLVGAVRVVRKIDFYVHTATNFAVMPGFGVDVPISERAGFRLDVAYSHSFVPHPSRSASSFRVVDSSSNFMFHDSVGSIPGVVEDAIQGAYDPADLAGGGDFRELRIGVGVIFNVGRWGI